VGPILVVDDDPQDLLIVSTTLRGMGFDVVEAPGGPEAQELISSGDHDFCMIVMDLYMPDIDGNALLRTVRRSLATQTLPVMVLTSSQDPQDELEVLEAGADDFLLKPVVVDRLEARVRAVLRRSGVHVSASDDGSGLGSWRAAPGD
jgi:two-component system KDP operon response regulator KdpE